MTTTLRRAATLVVTGALAGVLAGCGGGFSSAPADPPDETIRSYVALGDTFTAAPKADASGNDGCDRSHENYPALLAAELKVTDLRDVSCAGATTSSLTTETKPAKDKASVPPQLEAVDKDTDLVTIGAGLGDRDLLPHSFEICTALPCGDKQTPQSILADVDAMSASLTAAVRTIQDQAPGAYIVLVGYPKITPDSGSCEGLPELDQPSLDAANQVLDAVNRAIQSSARETGVGFLDVARLSVGHELCSGDPWVERPAESPRSKEKVAQTVDYRPVPAEQQAVADALASLVRNH